MTYFDSTTWTHYAFWPAQLVYGLITLNIIDQILDIDLQRWTPVRVRAMGYPQCTPSSNSTTLESNMSPVPNRVPNLMRAGEDILRRLTPLSGLQEEILQRLGLEVTLYRQLEMQAIGT